MRTFADRIQYLPGARSKITPPPYVDRKSTNSDPVSLIEDHTNGKRRGPTLPRLRGDIPGERVGVER